MQRRNAKPVKRKNDALSFGAYMNEKIRKLEDQFSTEANRRKEVQESKIFEGISVFVNGFTEPSADEIRHLMMKHGGTYQNYQKRGPKCYVIATQLAHGKAQKTMDRIVNPKWIVDSIAAGKLLNVNDYIVYETKGATGYRRIHDMAGFSRKYASLTGQDSETSPSVSNIQPFSHEPEDEAVVFPHLRESSNRIKETNLFRPSENDELVRLADSNKDETHLSFEVPEVGYSSKKDSPLTFNNNVFDKCCAEIDGDSGSSSKLLGGFRSPNKADVKRNSGLDVRLKFESTSSPRRKLIAEKPTVVSSRGRKRTLTRLSRSYRQLDIQCSKSNDAPQSTNISEVSESFSSLELRLGSSYETVVFCSRSPELESTRLDKSRSVDLEHSLKLSGVNESNSSLKTSSKRRRNLSSTFSTRLKSVASKSSKTSPKRYSDEDLKKSHGLTDVRIVLTRCDYLLDVYGAYNLSLTKSETSNTVSNGNNRSFKGSAQLGLISQQNDSDADPTSSRSLLKNLIDTVDPSSSSEDEDPNRSAFEDFEEYLKSSNSTLVNTSQDSLKDSFSLTLLPEKDDLCVIDDFEGGIVEESFEIPGTSGIVHDKLKENTIELSRESSSITPTLSLPDAAELLPNNGSDVLDSSNSTKGTCLTIRSDTEGNVQLSAPLSSGTSSDMFKSLSSRSSNEQDINKEKSPSAEINQIDNLSGSNKCLAEADVLETMDVDGLIEDVAKILPDNNTGTETNVSVDGVSNVDNNGAAVSNELRTTSNLKLDSRHQLPKTSADTGFLDEFYKRSRLHHIATQRTKLQDYVKLLKDRAKKDTDGNVVFDGRSELRRRQIDDLGANEDDSVQSYDGSPLIMHIDMDCFFVSVGIRNKPELKDKPVAVCHAKGEKRPVNSNNNGIGGGVDNIDFTDYAQWTHKEASTSEIASCSYAARKFGVHSGMLLGKARALCPGLVTIPYDFEAYDEVTKILYNTVASVTLSIEAVSCDELYADVTECVASTGVSPTALTDYLRGKIFDASKCSASVGLGPNMLIARLANRACKPNGRLYVSPSEAEAFVHNIKVEDLPGVGWQTSQTLHNVLKVKTCGDLQRVSLASLKETLGPTLGANLYDACRGIDKRGLKEDSSRKIVSAEVNYGIRFKNSEEARRFTSELAAEVFKRLTESKMATGNVRLKVLVRAKDAPVEPMKYLGCGHCDAISKSTSFHAPVSNLDTISRSCINMLLQIKALPTDIRGIGIQLTKLVPLKNDTTALDKFLQRASTSASTSASNSAEKRTMAGVSAASAHEKSRTAPSMNKLSENGDQRHILTKSSVKPAVSEINNKTAVDAETIVTDKPATSTYVSSCCRKVVAVLKPGAPKPVTNPSKDVMKPVGPKKLQLLKQIMYEWISGLEPKTNDISEWTDVLSFMLEDTPCGVAKLLSILYEAASHNESWQPAYAEIVSNLQSRVIDIYGYPLEVPLGFR